MSTAPHHYEVGLGLGVVLVLLVLAILALSVLSAGRSHWVCVLYQRLPLLRA